MLLSEIITEVISDVGGDTTDTDLQGKMLIFAKGALRRFPLFSRSRLLIGTSYATLEVGENYLTTPTGFIREISIYYVETDGNRKYIIKLTEGEFGSRVTTDSGTISYYRIVGNVIEFDRNTDTERVVYVEHHKEVDNLSLTDDFFGNTSMLEIMKDGIKATYYEDYTEDTTGRGNKALGRFKAGLDELEAQFLMSEQGEYITES